MPLTIRSNTLSAAQGDEVRLAIESIDAVPGASADGETIRWRVTDGKGGSVDDHLTISDPGSAILHTARLPDATYSIEAERSLKTGDPEKSNTLMLTLTPAGSQAEIAARALVDLGVRSSSTLSALARSVGDGVSVKLDAKERDSSPDQVLWVAIRRCLDGRSFTNYKAFIDKVLCSQDKTGVAPGLQWTLARAEACFYRHGLNGYELLDAATEVFLLCHACCPKLCVAGIDPDAETARLNREVTEKELEEELRKYLASSVSPGTLPYVGQVLKSLNLSGLKSDDYPFCQNSIRDQLCLFELIWSYWHEVGGLCQTMNALLYRFQNRTTGGRNPLANFALDPLRPLNNLLWGYSQTETKRLTVRRRAYEYDAEYGLRLEGKAVGALSAADSRSNFLSSFHSLLRQCAQFYQDDANALITPDPYPLLNAIAGVHLILAEGAHNQFGDLPARARHEMMVQQWLLSQPPTREFLQSRAMMPYDETWMGQVDAMKRLMGWTDVSVIHFSRLASFGERILLSIRYGNWSNTGTISSQAANWALYWRPEIQGYIHSYHAVTGVDLGVAGARGREEVDATMPSVLIARRESYNGNGSRGRSPESAAAAAVNGRLS